MAQENAPEEPAGLSLRGFFLAGIRLAHNRLQILSTEIAEERVRITLTAIAAVATLFFLGLTVVLGSVLLVVLFWEDHRVVLLSVLTGLFALLGAGSLLLAIKSLSRQAPPFQVTLAELRKDEDAWRSAPNDR